MSKSLDAATPHLHNLVIYKELLFKKYQDSLYNFQIGIEVYSVVNTLSLYYISYISLNFQIEKIKIFSLDTF